MSCFDGNKKTRNIDIQEVMESTNALEQRLGGVCGAFRKETVIFIGVKECALILTTLMVCSHHWHQFVGAKQNYAKAADLETLEECLLEEMWIMSRSHWSLLLDEPKAASNGETRVTFPSYQDFCGLYSFIKRRCLIQVSPPIHPLVSYATKTLVSSNKLSDGDRKVALDMLQIPNKETESGVNTDEKCQLENDKITSTVQSRIALWRRATNFAHRISKTILDKQCQGSRKRIHTRLHKPCYAFSPEAWSGLEHSCAPTLLMTMEDQSCREVSSKVESKPSTKLMWLTLHDIPSGEASISKINSLDADIKAHRKELESLMGSNFDSCVRKSR